MNRVRILRLDEGRREEYIRSEAREMSLPVLRHVVSMYGVVGTNVMNRETLIEYMVEGLLRWAEEELQR